MWRLYVRAQVTWEPYQEEGGDGSSAKFVVGDERVVIGDRPLVLREGLAKTSPVLMHLPPETRLQMYGLAEMDDGFRAHVRVVALPPGHPSAGSLLPRDEGSNNGDSRAAAAAAGDESAVAQGGGSSGGEASAEASGDGVGQSGAAGTRSRPETNACAKGGGSSSSSSAPSGAEESDGGASPPLTPPGEIVHGWITPQLADGKRRLARRHRKLEAGERRLQTELWNRRTAADRAAIQGAQEHGASGSTSGSSKGGATAAAFGRSKSLAASHSAGPCFAHELTTDPAGIGFAYGGIYPGTLHARGALVKTHQVHYSLGQAGRYLLHIGLRQKNAILPGSPFELEVRPGIAHAPSTQLPATQLPLESIVGTDGRLTVQMHDNMGNR